MSSAKFHSSILEESALPPYPRSAREEPPVARHVPISRSAFVRTILAELSELEPSAVSVYKCAAPSPNSNVVFSTSTNFVRPVSPGPA